MGKLCQIEELAKEQMDKYIELLKQMNDEEEEKPHRHIARKIYEELLKEKCRS